MYEENTPQKVQKMAMTSGFSPNFGAIRALGVSQSFGATQSVGVSYSFGASVASNQSFDFTTGPG